MNEIRIALAEDHQLVRQGMVSLLSEESGIDVVFDVSNGAELLDELKSTKVDVILLDLDMPVISGQQALKVIVKKYPETSVIIISMHYSDEFISECVAAGARGFLPKNCDIEKVVDAIYAVKEQGFYFDDNVSKAILYKLVGKKDVNPNSDNEVMSEREIQIVELLCDEKTTNEISEILSLSPRTVETYRNRIFEKTKSKNVVGVVLYAVKYGIYKPK